MVDFAALTNHAVAMAALKCGSGVQAYLEWHGLFSSTENAVGLADFQGVAGKIPTMACPGQLRGAGDGLSARSDTNGAATQPLRVPQPARDRQVSLESAPTGHFVCRLCVWSYAPLEVTDGEDPFAF